MHCKACGAMSRGTYDFCPKCGAYIKDHSETGLHFPKLHLPQRKTAKPPAKSTDAVTALPKPHGTPANAATSASAATAAATASAQLPTVKPPPSPKAAAQPASNPASNPSQPTLSVINAAGNGQARSEAKLPIVAAASASRLASPKATGSSTRLPAKRAVAVVSQPRQQIILRPINTPRSWREDPFWLYAGMIIFMALWLVAIVVGFGSAGVYHGLQDRTLADTAAAAEYKQKGKEYIVQDNLELAIAALVEARKRNPKDAEVAQLLASLEAKREVVPTPTAAPPPAVVKEAGNIPTEPVQPAPSAALTLDEARQLVQDKDYENAIPALETLRSLHPDNQKDIDELLHNVYVALAHAYLKEERWEEAIQKFDRALAIRKSDDLELERYLTSLYLRGLSSWSADWKRASESFAEIVRINAEYRDSYNRLYQARVAYGDQLLERANAPCFAEVQYAAALAMSNYATVQAKLEQAKTGCAANPVTVAGTPIPPVGNTATTRPATPTARAPAGAKYVVVISANIQATGDDEASIHGRVLDKNGKPLADLQMKAINKQGTHSRVEATSPDGLYSFNGLPPGDYTVFVVNDPTSVSASLYAGNKQRVFVNFTAK